MKNFTLLAAAALLAATSAFAAPQRSPRLPQNSPLQRPVAELRRALPGQAAQPRRAQAVKPQAAPDRGAIVTPPEGTLYEGMVVAFEGYAYSWFGISYVSTEAGWIDLVEAEDGNLYIYNLTSNLGDDVNYWLKADKVDDEGNYVIHRQPAGYYSSYDITDYVTRLVWDEEEEDYLEADDTDIHITWKDGVLATTDDINEDNIIGTVYEYSRETYWNGDGYWNLRAVPQTDTYSEPAADTPQETFVVKYLSSGETVAEGVKVAFEGSDVYLKLYDGVPGWVKGQVSGNQITIEGTQYLGIDLSYSSHEYAHAAKSELAYYEDEEEPDWSYYYDNFTEILPQDVLTFDPETRTISSANAITIDGSKTGFYYAAAFVQPTLAPFVEVPAVPADPDVTYFQNYDEEYGYGLTDFSIPTVDINGEWITPEKLSYIIYVDDEVFEFEPEEYESLTETLTEVPYTFDDGWDITEYGTDKEISFYFSIAQNVGVQSIYRGGGEEHRSNIVFFDIDTEETTVVEVDDALRDNIQAASAKSLAGEAYYDITGRRVAKDAKGLVIKTVTLADGTRRSFKLVRR